LAASLLLGCLLPVEASPQAPDSVYATPWVRALVEGAVARYRAEYEGAARSTSLIEAEIAVLVHRRNGEQIVTGVEQVTGRVTWSRDGSLVQAITGYRSRFAGPALSTLSYIRGPWVVAPLVGDRVPLALASDPPREDRREGRDTTSVGDPAEIGDTTGVGDPAEASDTTGVGDPAAMAAWEGTDASGRSRELPSMVNPLGADRDAHYRFSGGDTVLILRLPKRTIPVVRIAVEPRAPSPEFGLFRGEIHLDAVEHGVVRVRGEVLARARPRGALTRVMRATMSPHLLMDLEYSLGERGAWLSHRQWLELEVRSPLTEEAAVIRIVTDFAAATPDAAPSPEADTARTRARRALLRLGADPMGAGGGWRAELGAATAERNTADLSDLRARSAPQGLRFGTRAFTQVARYDRVEGLFTGGGWRAGGGAAESSAYAALHGGWAWSEGAARGGGEVGVTGPGWEVAAVAGRALTSTNDFPRPFVTGPTIFGVLGGDDLDYVDRWSAGVRGLLLQRGGASLRAEVEAVRDRAVALNVERAPVGTTFRPVRAVAEGDFARVGLAVGFGQGRGGEYLTPGWSAGIAAELARGDLDWVRVEASMRARRQLGRWSGAWEAYGGWVAAEAPPPQALFELGGWTSRLPGFPVKAFTGDRAAVGMAELAWALPVLEAPLRIRSLFLPSPSPTPLAQLSAGWTGASRNAAPVLDAHGWEVSDGARATLFLGVRLFSGLMRVGAARPFATGELWRFELGIGG
jgi:hypothetical protein